MKWEDLPKIKSCFTARNTTMVNLDNKKIIQYYSANTKIVVVQKYVSPEGTYYRTESAKRGGLNWAFKASALGLPDEKAPSAHSSTPNSQYEKSRKPDTHTPKPVKKQKVTQKVATPKDGEERQLRGWLRRIFRRKNG